MLSKLTRITFRFMWAFFLLLGTLLILRAWFIRPLVDFELLAKQEAWDAPIVVVEEPQSEPRRFWVVEKKGKIKWLTENSIKSEGLAADLAHLVNAEALEDGLLGLAFDPKFQENRFVYVYYSNINPYRTHLSRFTVQANNTLDPKSQLMILTSKKFFDGHNGGDLFFDKNGFLFLSLGEGSANRFQMSETHLGGRTLLGSIIRIDVSRASTNSPYDIPPDNPFLGHPVIRPEIWAYGFRNPWRVTYDPATERILAADVGDITREELNLVKKGGHYGWPVMEGELCWPPSSKIENCDQAKYEKPIATFGKAANQSIIGGYVYRGASIPWLRDQYVFADYLKGLFSIPYSEEYNHYENLLDGMLRSLFVKMPVQVGRHKGKTIHIVDFCQDSRGELLAADMRAGVYKLVPATFKTQLEGFFFKLLNFN